jgi:hypothetical protein
MNFSNTQEETYLNRNWKIGLSVLGTLVAIGGATTAYAADSGQGIPEQIAALTARVTQLESEVSQLLSSHPTPPMTTITLRFKEDNPGENPSLPGVEWLSGLPVTVTNSTTDAKYSGTTDANGFVVFHVPEGVYMVDVASIPNHQIFNNGNAMVIATTVQHPYDDETLMDLVNNP